MTIINEQTGLPALPEGDFWRVREEHYEYITFARTIVVELVHPFTVQHQYDRYVMGMRWGKQKPFTVKEETILATQVIWDDSKKAPKDYTGFYVALDRLPNGQFGGRFLPAQAEDLKPEQILAAAEKALAWYHQKLESAKLFGDYPPNVLPLPKPKE